MTGPFHGDTLVSFETLTTAITAGFAVPKYRAYVRDQSYMVVPLDMRPGPAVAEVTEKLKGLYPTLISAGFTMTVAAITPVVTWKTTYDRTRVKITFTHA